MIANKLLPTIRRIFFISANCA